MEGLGADCADRARSVGISKLETVTGLCPRHMMTEVDWHRGEHVWRDHGAVGRCKIRTSSVPWGGCGSCSHEQLMACPCKTDQWLWGIGGSWA